MSFATKTSVGRDRTKAEGNDNRIWSSKLDPGRYRVGEKRRGLYGPGRFAKAARQGRSAELKCSFFFPGGAQQKGSAQDVSTGKCRAPVLYRSFS